MPNLRKGAAAIEAAAESKGSGGDYKPFAPTIRWKDNNEEKYVLIITPIEETPVLDVHEFVQVGLRENGKPIFGFYASRKDPYFGESYDQLEDDFGIKPSERTFGVAVELEPEFDSSSGRRPRVKRFKVATDTYEKKNENGGDEEVTYPLVGIISQAAGNFYNHVRSNDADYGPIYELPLKIKRIGTGKDTQYSFTPFMDQEVDFSNLIEYIGGVGYVDKEVVDKAKTLDTDAAAQLIAENILDKRINELADKEAYDEAVNPLTEIKGFNKVHHRNADNTEATQEVEATEPETTEPEEPTERDAAFDRIKQRAAAKASRSK